MYIAPFRPCCHSIFYVWFIYMFIISPLVSLHWNRFHVPEMPVFTDVEDGIAPACNIIINTGRAKNVA